MHKFIPGGVAEMVYNTDIVPNESLLKKLHYFYHPYSAQFNIQRYMTFDEDDYTEGYQRDLKTLEEE